MPDSAPHISLVEEQILAEAVEKTGRAYQEAPTVANLREWNAARAAQDKYHREQEAAATGHRFRNLAEVARWLIRQGYKVNERTVRNHHKAGLFPVQAGGEFRQADIEAYAKNHLDRPGYEGEYSPAGSAKDRLAEAMAEERELRNKKLKGELIDAAEEEARDARLWRAVRADMENHAPGVINELVDRVMAAISDQRTAYSEQEGLEAAKQRITGLVPELRLSYEEFLAELFDRYAQQGGIEVEL
jgi:hypothetical protein